MRRGRCASVRWRMRSRIGETSGDEIRIWVNFWDQGENHAYWRRALDILYQPLGCRDYSLTDSLGDIVIVEYSITKARRHVKIKDRPRVR